MFFFFVHPNYLNHVKIKNLSIKTSFLQGLEGIPVCIIYVSLAG